jgi:integrase
MKKVFHKRIYKVRRMSHGKKIMTYRGYFTLERNGKRHFRSLGTPDKRIAEKRIDEMALQAQREQEGLIPPRAEREAAIKGLDTLIAEYDDDLKALGRAPKHVHDTITRIGRIIAEAKWRHIGDVRADEFLSWRAKLDRSAKTKKEFQISLNAFLNWLVASDRLAKNPLAKIEGVETRGKQVRVYRSFSEDELARLFAIAGKRKLPYQMLLYTGQRKSEVRRLVWSDLHLDGDKPHALFRASTMKDKDKRAVPLRPEIAEALRGMRPADYDPAKRVFWYCWPTYDWLCSDIKRAGIEKKDAMGKVVHFHSFRKTFQTLGVKYGINQRAAQEMLGHSDPRITAEVYTDVPALGLEDEITKLPWIGDKKREAQCGAQKFGASSSPMSLNGIMSMFVEALKVHDAEEVSHALASAVTSCHEDQMAARAGIEPATK